MTRFGGLVFAGALAALAGVALAPGAARADGYWHGYREAPRHWHHGPVVYGPGVVVAPPVYVAPAPVYVPPPPPVYVAPAPVVVVPPVFGLGIRLR